MVAPRAGAWIEIASCTARTEKEASLPVRERGLKLNLMTTQEYTFKSLPVRERGLKS